MRRGKIMSDTSKAIGPRVVGGRYFDGYWRQEYEVTDIQPERPDWMGWSITIRWDDGFIAEHCTAWDERSDKVVSQP
jgi:hypothetical protein